MLSATLWVYACGDGTTEPRPYFPEPTTVTVSPSTAELTALGATVQLSAEVRDQKGAVMDRATVTWASSAAAATVGASGLVTAAANGSATITATAGDASGSAAVTVAQEVSAVAVAPDTTTVVLGDTLRLAATATDANGQRVAGVDFEWASADTAVAVVDASGLVTGVGAGEVQVTATAAGLTGRAELAVVTPLPTTVAVTPDTVVLTAVGQTAQLTAEVLNQGGRVMDGIPVTWLSAETTVAAVDASGLVTAVGHGSVTVTATAGEASGDAHVTVLSNRDILEIFYEATGGPDWIKNDGWLTDAALDRWHGVEVDHQGRVVKLHLAANGLAGTLPAEIGSLANLGSLSLRLNNLTGPIPLQLGSLANLRILDLDSNSLEGAMLPDLGSLAELQVLFLSGNRLEGPIPAELGNLDNLGTLWLSDNNLSGAIPPELGNLHNLWRLYLGRNDLSGTIPHTVGSLGGLQELSLAGNRLKGLLPPELGHLTDLKLLYLGHNQLTGPVPEDLGALANLETLSLTANTTMSGALPSSLTSLGSLETLEATGTQLCAPSDPSFLEWLNRLASPRVALCESQPAYVYLVQAVQSRDFPVPLVAGEEALLRVFVTAGRDNSESLPPVRASFHLNGALVHMADIPAAGGPIPTEVDESSLSKSANAVIAGRVIQPGLEMVIEVDPEGTLDPELGVSKRIPETGRLAVAVEAMPLFDLTLIPFVWTQTQDSSIVDLVEAMAADPENHEMFSTTRALLPIGALVVTAHKPVLSSSNNARTLLNEIGAIRAMEGGAGHYKGMMSPPVTGSAGVAAVGGRISFSQPYPGVIVHELGHNLNLSHAPCGGARGPDPAYPYPDGSTGVWGYDFQNGGSLVTPKRPDLMSYCGPQWISDYHFTNALRYRLFDEGRVVTAVSASTRSLLLWGGVGADTVPYLEPAFVIDAPPALPDSAGAYRISGRTASRADLFSLSFTMPETADGDGSSSFAFALPVRAGWEGSLASITLSGPGGSVTLDGESDIPTTILRDPRTGQVRGILRDPPLAGEVAADALEAAAPGLEVLFSRGIPGGAAWTR